eukprot:TRINITY_DN37431_c0_g1_i1.p1 TRINITY_DN37431_c0_g1~~TRINITY_DN37431_c0_g1_i1.p1  ORF type:complete len:177 (+),score=36.66 TRINITY_DN37431_c0_g1_i1:56-532(+)
MPKKELEPWMLNIAARVQSLVIENKGAAVLPATHPYGAFVSASVPEISIAEYINASYKAAVYCKLQHPMQCWEAALLLVERLPQKVVSDFTVHRLLLTAYLIGMKLTSDKIITNKVIALYGGVTMKELNTLERLFLVAIDFKVNITRSQYRSLWVYRI